MQGQPFIDRVIDKIFEENDMDLVTAPAKHARKANEDPLRAASAQVGRDQRNLHPATASRNTCSIRSSILAEPNVDIAYARAARPIRSAS